MVGVFAIFATLPILDMKEMGIGLRGRRPDRRDDRPGGAPARHDEAARRLELVPAEVARVAAPTGARDPRPEAAPEAAPAPALGA